MPPELRAPTPVAPSESKPTGRQAVPAHLVEDKEVIPVAACAGCGGTELTITGQEIAEKLHTIREHLRRRVIVRKTCLCKDCGRTTTAPMPPMPWARSKYTSAVVAHVVHQKMVLHVPLDRLRRDWALRGVPVSISVLVRMMANAGELLAAIDGEHHKQLIAGSWLHTDGSGLDVIIEGNEGVARGIVDVFTRDDLAVYTFSLSKDGEELAERLTRFSGTLIADAESRLNAVYADGSVVEAGCNAHGIRKFKAALIEQPLLAAEGQRFIQVMFQLEAEATEKGLTGDARKAWRQEHIRPIAQDFRRWLDIVGEPLVPKTPLYGAVNYYRNNWDALMRFIDHPDIPASNNASERLFRTLDSGCLNWLFAGNSDSAHNLCVLMGLTATCRLQGVDTEAWLAWALDRRGTCRSRFGLSARDLTPAAYKQALEQEEAHGLAG